MAGPTQFRHYLIAQDAEGKNIEVVRSAEQVGVLAFDVHRLVFVHFHVLLEPLKNRAAFEERAQLLQDQGHARLARLLDHGEDEGSPFYITSHVDGETLRSYLDRAETLPVWLAMRLTQAALEAVQVLMTRGDFLPTQPMEGLRVVQTGAQDLAVVVSDYRISDDSGARAKTRQVRTGLDKQAQFLLAFFQERLESGISPTDSLLQTTDFTEILLNLLLVCEPDKETAIDTLAKEVAALIPPVPAGELAASCKPRTSLGPFLAGITDVARSVAPSVRIQSQKMNAAQPYALRGSLLRMGQAVVVEQVTPARLTGTIPAETLKQVLNLPKSGKFPNLVPVLFVEENDGIQCVAETAVEGVTLQEVLEARAVLGVQEIYLVLAGVDTALGQLEKAGLSSRQLRLEDVFLFTGFGKESPRESGLLNQKLNEWPGFSVVIRAHPSLHGMAGRGTDPALLLPVEPKTAGDAEPIWNGGWMAALGCFLAGMPDADAQKHETGIAETDSISRLLEDEVQRARRSTPVTRAAFLAKFARVVQQHDVSKVVRTGAMWTELSGSSASSAALPPPLPSSPPMPPAPGPPAALPPAAVEMPTPAPPPPPVEPPPRSTMLPERRVQPQAPQPVHTHHMPTQPSKPTIGFAEALIRQPQMGGPEEAFEPGGLRPIRGHSQPPPDYHYSESSWSPMHEAMSFWMRLVLVLLSSMALGAGLAHLSGRALWQGAEPPKAVLVEEPSQPKIPAIELPTAAPAKPAGAPSLPPPPSALLKDLDLDPKSTPPRSIGTAGTPAPSPAPAPAPATAPSSSIPSPTPPAGAMPDPSAAPVSPSPAPAATPVVTAPAPPPSATSALDVRLAELRKTGGRLPPSLRQETEKAAAAGSPEAMLALGRLSLSGQAGAPNARTAYLWFERAAQGGHVPATVALAECYLQGWGVPEDPVKAVELLGGAVSAGDSTAADLLGVCYARGKGTARDDARAFALCSRAYEAGIPSACGNLGALYLRGQGVTADPERAVALFAEGSNRGHAESMMLYARALEYGTGIPADRAVATQWYQKAASLGNAEAVAWCREKGVVF